MAQWCSTLNNKMSRAKIPNWINPSPLVVKEEEIWVANCAMEVEISLVRAWQGITLERSNGANYWGYIEEHFHQRLGHNSNCTLKSRTNQWGMIEVMYNHLAGCLDQVKHAPPSGVTIDQYVSTHYFDCHICITLNILFYLAFVCCMVIYRKRGSGKWPSRRANHLSSNIVGSGNQGMMRLLQS